MNWMRKFLLCCAMLACLLAAAGAQQTAPANPAPSVDDEVIQQVLEPLRTGLTTQNIQLILSVFDKKELDSYSDLERQLGAFFQQFDKVNFRYQLLQVTSDNDHGSAIVEMEMDALPYDVTQVATRRSVQMRLRLKLGPKGWKIAGFTPGDFFNVEYKAATSNQ